VSISSVYLVLKIVEIYKSLVAISKHVIFTWIPSHIHGNTVVDQEAKNTLDDPVSNCSIPYTDFKPFKLVTKYQVPVINSCLEKCDEK
jgi:hypothetical protein